MLIRLFVLISLCLPLSASAATLEVSGWVPYWRIATGTAEVLAHSDVITEVNPFGLSVKANGTLKDHNELDTPQWQVLASSTPQRKIRYVPTVMWSDGNAIHNTLSNATKRRALASEIADLVKEKGWDGIDINFEGKKAETRPYFSLFLQGLQTKLGSKKWLMCTIEARTPLSSRYTKNPPKDATNYANDLKAIGKYCDRVRIMAYDQGAIDVKLNADALGPYIPVADVKWVEKSILLMMNDIPKRKISIGIPTYGYEYEVTPLSNGGYEYDKLWAFNPRYALDISAQRNIPPTRNQAGELSLVYVATSTGAVSTTTPFRIMWWSDAQAIADKVALAKKLGVRGVSVFKFDGGADPLMWSAFK